MGFISDLRDAHARSSAEKFEKQKNQYLGEVWDAARGAAEGDYRARLERAEAERDALAQRVEALEARVRELEAQTLAAHAPEPKPKSKPEPKPKPDPKPESTPSKADQPAQTPTPPASTSVPSSPGANFRAPYQIRLQHPKETDGLKLHHDTRLSAASFREYGLDAWYTIGEDGTLAYYYREEHARQPPEWRDRWFGPVKHLGIVEKTLYKHGIPLVDKTDQGKRIVAQKHRFEHKGDARKKAAIQDLCNAALAETRLVLNAGDEIYEMEEATSYAYATHLARRVGYRHNESLDGGVGPAWQAEYPILDDTNYLRCCLLESLCEGGARGMVIPKKAMQRNVDARIQCVRIVRELGLRFTMLAQLDAKDLEKVGIAAQSDPSSLFYDLTKDRFVAMRREGNALSFVPVTTEVQQGDASFVSDAKARIFVRGASYHNALGSFAALAAKSKQIRLCGGYQYTKGDVHDATWDHDYYVVRGNSPQDFGIKAQGGNEWATYTIHVVDELSTNRTYDHFYLRICDTFLKAWVQQSSADGRAWDSLGMGATLLFAPIGRSRSIDKSAQEVLRSLEYLL